ncbi:hypothetical protein [Photobacterium rosenbergii]|uniref:hypothetical protein n=1 Tax=Photobacterium rosenbergii TaxID=294936 RepID=UPI001C99C1BC|nr:hypothetical protein [Photobacterium rosenbergii]MBY5947636.1 hypothetical protein [Photobacterium rosenbergii]
MSTPDVKPRVDITSTDVSPLKVDNSEATKLDKSGERQDSQQEIQQPKNTLSTTEAVLIGAAVATAVKVSRDNKAKAKAPARTKPEVPPTKNKASSKKRVPSSSHKKSNKEKVKRANSKRSSSSRKSSSRKSSSRRR